MDISLTNLIELVKKVNRNKVPTPMSAEEISRLRVRKYRDPQNTETTELPESLKALLAYDRDLLSNYNMPVIETLQRSIDKEGVIHSYSPDEEAYYGVGMDSSGIDIEDLMPVWSNDPRLPALIRIDHVGDQAIFIYITERMPTANTLLPAWNVMNSGWRSLPWWNISIILFRALKTLALPKRIYIFRNGRHSKK